MRRTTAFLGFFAGTVPRLLDVSSLTLKQRIVLERKRRAKQSQIEAKAQEGRSYRVTDGHLEMPDDEEIAKEVGIVEPDFVDVDEVMKKKQILLAQIQRQRERRIARRSAWEEWQAGQKEKGNAMSIYRKTKKAERTKRMRANSAAKKLVSVAYYTPAGENTNNQFTDAYNCVMGSSNQPRHLVAAGNESKERVVVVPGSRLGPD